MKEQERKKEEDLTSEELKRKLEKCREQKEEYLAGWKRARADFINYKKKEKERMEEFLKFSTTDLISGLLPVLDSFERAEESLEEGVEGFSRIKGQIKKVLEGEGLEEVEIEGKEFDPGVAEAVERVKTEEEEKGTVVEVVRKGYRLKERLIRPARVKVAE